VVDAFGKRKIRTDHILADCSDLSNARGQHLSCRRRTGYRLDCFPPGEINSGFVSRRRRRLAKKEEV
jgi:hypothetical protein